MNKIDLGGRRAVITGGSSGIGSATVQRMATRDDSVVRHQTRRSRRGLRQAAGRERLSRRRHGRGRRDALDAEVLDDVGRVDIVVNSAGIAGERHPVSEFPLATWKLVIEINLTGTFICCKAVVPAMQKNNYGRIVNISSTGRKGGNPLVSPYGASKTDSKSKA